MYCKLAGPFFSSCPGPHIILISDRAYTRFFHILHSCLLPSSVKGLFCPIAGTVRPPLPSERNVHSCNQFTTEPDTSLTESPVARVWYMFVSCCCWICAMTIARYDLCFSDQKALSEPNKPLFFFNIEEDCPAIRLMSFVCCCIELSAAGWLGMNESRNGYLQHFQWNQLLRSCFYTS